MADHTAPRLRLRAGDAAIVIGLGRFGSAVATTLEEMGHQVLGVDASEGIVADHASRLTHVLQADSTRIETLEEIGAKDVAVAVVAIGTDIEASILTTSALVDLGIASIWAKALTASHARILDRVGAHHVVFPEREMGDRVAHQVTGRMIDWIQLEDDFALVETTAPADMVGRTIGESGARQRHGVTIVCIKPVGQTFTYATAETVVQEGDLLLVAAEARVAEAFANLR
ncbi:TrkA family potassium uptake protein [Iamia majanohamensis]|uniref:TrkA family potassium uptake protein n=1 Tax=Iamia majanohamensis TaxID=467976 RepID=A0AAE9Y8W3_9ACTN|nr:TrkA family potassium uptake protein [Iamia majanohamensis]WCO66643.1 TrkA family potassium uptake protein [Iamia majanohamensis]